MPAMSPTRTFTLLSPLGDALRFVRLAGHEALSQVAEYKIDFLAQSPDVDFRSLIGAAMGVQITTQKGSTRYLQGICTQLTFIGPDNSAERRYKYSALVHSSLHLASKDKDCMIYEELTPSDLIKQVLTPLGIRLDFKLNRTYKAIPYIVRWNESSLQFVMRVAERYGLYFYTRHTEKDHTIVFTDGRHLTLPEDETISFLRPGDRPNLKPEEYIAELEIQHTLQAGTYSTNSYDYTHPRGNLQIDQTVQKNHPNDALTVYEWEGNYVDSSLGEKQVSIRRQQQQLDFQVMRGEGNARGIAPGYYFKLTRHPRAEMNAQYLIVSASYTFHESADTSHDSRDGTSWHIGFTIRPSKDAYVPPRVTPWPVIPTQTAVVVGPDSAQEIWTNEYGEVKIRYHWEYQKRTIIREKWIPVATSLSGTNNASQFIPRIGDTLIIDHYNGNPDMPVAIVRAHDAWHKPPRFSSTGSLPDNHALTGIRSNEIGGRGYNQILFDDTAGEVRTQIESNHANSQLNLGFITQPRSGSAAPRGEGAELTSQAWAVVRATKGVFLTSDALPADTGNALSRNQLVDILQEALNIAKSQGDFAAKNQANPSDPAPQETLSKAVHDWGHGSNVEKDQQGGNGGVPLVAISAPAGIALGTPKSTTIATGQHLDMVAQQNQHLTAGQKMNLHAGQGISQFAQNGGIKSIANHGKHITQSQDDDIQITADKSVQITASTDHVMIQADKHITLMCGGGIIKLAGGNVDIHVPGTISMKAGNYNLAGPASAQAALPQFGKGDTGKKFKLHYGNSDAPVANQPYKITMDDGQIIKGVSDAEGHTSLVEKDQMRMAKIELLKKDQ